MQKIKKIKKVNAVVERVEPPIYSRLTKKFKQLFWEKKSKFRIKKLKYKTFSYTKKAKSFYSHRINIKVTGNNVFCTLVRFNNNKILCAASAGTLKVKTSAKSLKKYSLNRILYLFCKKAKKKLSRSGFVVFLTVPIHSRKKVLHHIKKLRTFRTAAVIQSSRKRDKGKTKVRVTSGSRKILIKFFSKKIFNGCRAPKAKRKKRNRKLKG